MAIRFNPPPEFFASYENWQSMCLSFASTLLWVCFWEERERHKVERFAKDDTFLNKPG